MNKRPNPAIERGVDGFGGSTEVQIVFSAFGSLLMCLIAFGIGFLVLPHSFEFPTDMVDRIVFALRTDLFIVLWLVVGPIFASVRKFNTDRMVGSVGVVKGDKPSRSTAALEALANTREQVLLGVIVHLGASTLISGNELTTIVVAAVLFAIGRIIYFLFHPKHSWARFVGIVMTVMPSYVLIAFAFVRLASKCF